MPAQNPPEPPRMYKTGLLKKAALMTRTRTAKVQTRVARTSMVRQGAFGVSLLDAAAVVSDIDRSSVVFWRLQIRGGLCTSVLSGILWRIQSPAYAPRQGVYAGLPPGEAISGHLRCCARLN